MFTPNVSIERVWKIYVRKPYKNNIVKKITKTIVYGKEMC